MLYTLLCILVFIAIIKLLQIEWVFGVIGFIVFGAGLILVWYFLPEWLRVSLLYILGACGLFIIFRQEWVYRKNKKIKQQKKEQREKIIDKLRNETKEKKYTGDDVLYEEAREIVIKAGKASTSYIQRKLRVGYARAARLKDLLEENGVIAPANGSEPNMVINRPEEKEENNNA